jgi:hypothetical protein
MSKRLIVILFVALVALSANKAFAFPADDDDTVVTPKPVPDASSMGVLAGCAATGLVGLRLFLRKKD